MDDRHARTVFLMHASCSISSTYIQLQCSYRVDRITRPLIWPHSQHFRSCRISWICLVNVTYENKMSTFENSLALRSDLRATLVKSCGADSPCFYPTGRTVVTRLYAPLCQQGKFPYLDAQNLQWITLIVLSFGTWKGCQG